MKQEISSETKRRLALGLSPVMENRNRVRKSASPNDRRTIIALTLWGWTGWGIVFILMFFS